MNKITKFITLILILVAVFLFAKYIFVVPEMTDAEKCRELQGAWNEEHQACILPDDMVEPPLVSPDFEGEHDTSHMVKVGLGMVSVIDGTEIPYLEIEDEALVSDILPNDEAYMELYGYMQKILQFDDEKMREFWMDMTSKALDATVGDYIDTVDKWYKQ